MSDHSKQSQIMTSGKESIEAKLRRCLNEGNIIALNDAHEFFLKIKKDLSHNDLIPLKLTIAANWSLQFLVKGLEVALFSHGINATIQEVPFGQWEPWLLSTDSPVFSFKPDIILILLTEREFLSRPFEAFIELESRIVKVVSTLQRLSNAKVVCSILSNSMEDLDQFSVSTEIKKQVIDNIINRTSNIAKWLSLSSFLCSVGYNDRADRYWVYSKIPFHPDLTGKLALFLGEHLSGLCRSNIKLVITDLDGTLWGGVLGEDGKAGIELDSMGSGFGYLRLQRYLLDLKKRGVLLAICSKNERKDIENVFKSRREMILSINDFVAVETSWEPKSKSVRKILEKLNLSSKQVMFLDDSPFEREEVCRVWPDLIVPSLENDPSLYVENVIMCGSGYVCPTTKEDMKRAQYIQDDEKRRQLKVRISDMGTFIESLGLVVENYQMDNSQLDRAEQLVSRTNQFNLNCKRYSRSNISDLMIHKENYAYIFKATDKFGEYGFIGLLLAIPTAIDEYEIDIFCLSCRAIGRRIERYMIEHLTSWLKQRDITKLKAIYVPCPKNSLIPDVMKSLGFNIAKESPDNSRIYELVF